MVINMFSFCLSVFLPFLTFYFIPYPSLFLSLFPLDNPLSFSLVCISQLNSCLIFLLGDQKKAFDKITAGVNASLTRRGFPTVSVSSVKTRLGSEMASYRSDEDRKANASGVSEDVPTEHEKMLDRLCEEEETYTVRIIELCLLTFVLIWFVP